MTYEEMINLELKTWNKFWEGPIPEPLQQYVTLTSKDLCWLGHMFWMNLSLGLTKKERKDGVRTWTKEKLTEYCQRCMRLSSPLLEELVDFTWLALGQIDARRENAGFDKLYRDIAPDDLQPLIVPRINDAIIYEKNGMMGQCKIKEKFDNGWLGISEDGTTITGSDLEVVEIVIYDGWRMSRKSK